MIDSNKKVPKKELVFKYEETKYGFTWGPMKIERIFSHPKVGVVIRVETTKDILEIRATPKGILKVLKFKPIGVKNDRPHKTKTRR